MLATAIVAAKDKPFAVIFTANIDGHSVPDGIVKIGETGTAKKLTEVISPESKPPIPDIGWAMEITPVRDKANNLVGRIVIRSATMKVDESEVPLTISTESTFRFSLPVNGAAYVKDLPGLGKISLTLKLVDAIGNQIKIEQPADGKMPEVPQSPR